MVQPMQMPAHVGAATDAVDPAPLRHVAVHDRAPAAELDDALRRAVLRGEVALLVVAGSIAALVHRCTEEPLRPQLRRRAGSSGPDRWPGRAGRGSSRRGCRDGSGSRARTRSGCPPSTSSPSPGSRARPWRPWGCPPWRGCRRRWRTCRRPARRAPWGPDGRATRWSSWAGRCRDRCRTRTSSPRDLIASLGIDPSTTSTNGSSSPRSALKNHSRKSSAPPTGPHSKSISGQCTAIFGSPGSAPRAISSMLGWVAAVSATESPSQLSPALIHRTWMSGSSASVGVPAPAVSVVAMDPPLLLITGTITAGRPGVRSGSPQGGRWLRAWTSGTDRPTAHLKR